MIAVLRMTPTATDRVNLFQATDTSEIKISLSARTAIFESL